MKNASSLFTMIKAWSVVWPERMFAHVTKEANHLTEKELSGLSQGPNDVLRMNIFEAYVSDNYWLLLRDNALAAATLLHEPEMLIKVSDGNKKKLLMEMNNVMKLYISIGTLRLSQ